MSTKYNEEAEDLMFELFDEDDFTKVISFVDKYGCDFVDRDGRNLCFRNGLNNASNNCTFCYIPNGFRDKKKNQKVFILKENMKGHLGIPKKYVEEIADYNGLRYLSTFEWE